MVGEPFVQAGDTQRDRMVREPYVRAGGAQRDRATSRHVDAFCSEAAARSPKSIHGRG